MKILKTLVLFVLFISSASIFAQQKHVEKNIPKGANLINLNDAKYAGMSFENILNQYKGKVIYLDFWASWCRPCKSEMPYSLKLQKHFKGKDVVFVYLSSDRDPKAWKNAIAMLRLTGEDYLVNAAVYNQYNKLFNVRYIPRYVLIDKQGKVVNANALRPSNPESIKDIEKLL